MLKRFAAMLLAVAVCSPALALPKAPENPATAYFTQFNGYPWGMPIETILKDGVVKYFVLKGPQKFDKTYAESDNLTKRFLRLTTWKPEKGIVPVIDCDYYMCRYPLKSNKYTFVCYAVKDGRLIAGMFEQYNVRRSFSSDKHRWFDHVFEISIYISKNIKNKSLSLTDKPPFYVWNGRYYSEHSDLESLTMASDSAGSGVVWLKYGILDSFFLHVYSPEWLRLVEKEAPERRRILTELRQKEQKRAPSL